MSVKRLAYPLCAIAVLLVLAGLIELYLAVNPSDAEAMPAESSSSSAQAPREIHLVEQEAILEAKKLQREQEQRERLLEREATDLVESGLIVVDGAPLSHDVAMRLVSQAGGFTGNVVYIDQKRVLKSGCEIVALAVALQAEGFDVSPADIADRHLRIGSNVALDYLGDPRGSGGGLPQSIVDAANGWAAEQGVSAHAYNLTGTSFDGIAALVDAGYPVLVWTTERLAEPRFSGSVVDGLQWYRPEHCVVVYGFEGDGVLVSDSLEGLVRRNLANFAHIYEACGNKAVLVAP